MLEINRYCVFAIVLFEHLDQIWLFMNIFMSIVQSCFVLAIIMFSIATITAALVGPSLRLTFVVQRQNFIQSKFLPLPVEL